jgi:hypothetical protein
MAETPSSTDRASRHHEESDVQVGLILMSGIGLVVMTTVVLLVAYWLFNDFAARWAKLQVPPSPLAETRQPPPEPRLQVVPAQDLQQMRAAEEGVLSSYGWVDEAAGFVRMPIDRAIELLLERGLPVWRENRAPQTEDGAAKSPGGGG